MDNFLSFLFFVAVDIIFDPSCKLRSPCPLFLSASQIYQAFLTNSTNAQWLAAILIIAAGVPLGFVVYQAYFFLRWNSPASRDGLSGLMAGRSRDLVRMTNGIPAQKLWRGPRWRRKWVESEYYKKDHKDKWRYIEMLFTEASQLIDSKFTGVSFYQRHRYLHEVMHTIGASIGAIYIAFASYIFYMGIVEGIQILTYGTLTGLACAFLFYFINSENLQRHKYELKRKKATKSTSNLPVQAKILGFSVYDPAAGFLYLVIALHFVFNPIFHQPTNNWTDLIARLIPLLFASMFWIISRGLNWRGFLLHDISMTLVLPAAMIGLFYNIYGNTISSFDWGYISASTVFLAGSLFLLKNRQNAAGDMIALENYLLKLYLFGDRRS